MISKRQESYLEKAIVLSRLGMESGKGGPFGCVIVRNDEIIAEGYNQVIATNDPTAHAEIVAIRLACLAINDFQLRDCEIYCSCEPCPMCLGAIYWARPKLVVFANTREGAKAIGFDDEFIYQEIEANPSDRKISFYHSPLPSAVKVFEDWKSWVGKRPY